MVLVCHRRNFQGTEPQPQPKQTDRSERAVRDDPHLFLTVSACTPGVAFLSRNFHPIGQSSSRDALGGLQACLNLRVTSIIMYDSEHVYEQTIDLHLILWPTEVSIGQQYSKQ